MKRLLTAAKHLLSCSKKAERGDPYSPDEIRSIRFIAECAKDELSGGDETWTKLAQRRPWLSSVPPAVKVAFAAAALLAIAGIGIWVFLLQQEPREQGPPRLASSVAIRVRASALREPERGAQSAPVFKLGDSIYLHLNVEGEATAFVAVLDNRGRLAAEVDGPHQVHRGSLPLGGYAVAGEPGSESAILIAGSQTLTREGVESLLRAAQPGVTAGRTHDDLLREVVLKLRAADPVLVVEAVTYTLVAP